MRGIGFIVSAAPAAQDVSISANTINVISLAVSLLVLLIGVLVLIVTLLGYARLVRRMEEQTARTRQLEANYAALQARVDKVSVAAEFSRQQELHEALEQVKQQQAALEKRLVDQKRETSDTILAMTLLPLGARQYRSKDISGALDTYKRALSLDDNNPTIYYHLGYIYAQTGKLDLAEEHLKKALSIDPAFAPATAALGYVYRRKGEAFPAGEKREKYLVEAEAKLLEALQAAPRLLDEEGESWWTALGGLYRHRAQIKKAINAYQEAQKITPYSSYPLVQLALQQGASGDEAAMLQSFREVERLARQKVQANPDNYWPYSDLLLARLAFGKIQEAEDILSMVLKLIPRDLAYATSSLLVNLSRLTKLVPSSAQHIERVIKYVRESLIEGRQAALSSESFVIPFEQFPAIAVRASNQDDPAQLLKALDLNEARPAVFILGGAMDMQSKEMQETRPVIEYGLTAYAQRNGVAIVDGGTSSGVMKLMGETRRAQNGTFPLIGVAPINLVRYQGYENPSGYDLDPGHSHFVLTSEGEWGDETDMIIQLAYALTGQGKFPGLGLIINGGNIVRQEVYRLSGGKQLKVPLVVLEGSGRFADTLAAAIRTRQTDDAELREIILRDNIEVVSVSGGPKALENKLIQHLEKNSRSQEG